MIAKASTRASRWPLPGEWMCRRRSTAYAGWADKVAGEVVPARRDALTYIHRVPVGVVAAIVAWISH
jgi:hypothetical protein